MAPIIYWTGQMKLSQGPVSSTSTTQKLCPRAMIVTEMRVSYVMGTACTLLDGVMTRMRDIVKTPKCGQLTPDFVPTQPFGKKKAAT